MYLFRITAVCLTLLYGVGLLMVCFACLYRIKQKRRVASMEFYVTSRAVVFKETSYSMFGCCFANTNEKHVLKPLAALPA
jgi:hypothetical protein